MSNSDHIDRLTRGTEVWNGWRKDHPTERLDLSQARLEGTDLRGADLTGVRLDESSFTNVDLAGANLSRSNLEFASFKQSKLTEANVTEARWGHVVFEETDLSSANFYKTDLVSAVFLSANLAGAHFASAFLCDAAFGKVSLFRGSLKYANLSGASLGGIDLREADLEGADLGEAYLAGADLTGACLIGAKLTRTRLPKAKLLEANMTNSNCYRASLVEADLSRAILTDSDLTDADLRGSNLSRACLRRARLEGVSFDGANLSGAILERGVMINTSFEGANLTGARIFGISAWDIKTDKKTKQNDLVVTTGDAATVTVDNIEVAQFVYLLLNREKLRSVLTTLGERSVLILGRFTERKALLEGIVGKVRSLGYLPIVFDFERPTDRDLTETVKVLAGLSLFVVADITNPRSVPLELQATVPDYMVPFVTLVERGQPVFGMFDDLPRKYDWALPLLEYNSAESLLAAFENKVVAPALEKLAEVRRRKALPPPRRSAED